METSNEDHHVSLENEKWKFKIAIFLNTFMLGAI